MMFKKKFDKQPESSIRVTGSTYRKTVMKKIFSQALLIIFGLVLVYFCFAATIIRFVPTTTGFVFVKNNTHSGGVLPIDSRVLVSLDKKPVGDTISDRLMQSVVPQKPTGIMNVVAGPIGELSYMNGVVSVDGVALPATFPESFANLDYLENEYIAVCIQGDCELGAPYIILEDNVLGIPLPSPLER